jgi:hypothetical protein
MEDDEILLMELIHDHIRGLPVSWIISGKQICRFERVSDVSSFLSVFVCMCPLGACFPKGTIFLFAL